MIVKISCETMLLAQHGSQKLMYLNTVLAQQCFSGLGCTGSVVAAPGPSASDCCVGTDDGQSYGSPGACTIPQCIGIILFPIFVVSLGSMHKHLVGNVYLV